MTTALSALCLDPQLLIEPGKRGGEGLGLPSLTFPGLTTELCWLSGILKHFTPFGK